MDGQDDLLEQIITQGLDKLNAPAQTAGTDDPPEAAPSPPNAENGAGTARLTDRKAKRTAVYLYLVVLFGAAFLMLLLAYFVQQRSSEDTISDLRNSMNLSREGLLAEIRDLEAQNSALNVELTQLQTRYEEQVQDANNLWIELSTAQKDLSSWDAFWSLEQYYQLENYDTCAVLLLMQEQDNYRIPQAVQARYAEIVRAVIDTGILDEDYAQHPEDYNDLLDA